MVGRYVDVQYRLLDSAYSAVGGGMMETVGPDDSTNIGRSVDSHLLVQDGLEEAVAGALDGVEGTVSMVRRHIAGA